MEFSTLNGYKVKDKKAIRYYDTVNDMIDDTTLKNGMHVKTKGYYSANDGGHGEYQILNGNLTPDNGSIIELSNGLFAKIIDNGIIDIKQFGAYGNNTNDDTLAFTNALTYCGDNEITLYISSGTYKITSELTLSKPINIKGHGMRDTIIKLVNETPTVMFNITENATMCKIEELTLQGINYLHTCIRLSGNVISLYNTANWKNKFERLNITRFAIGTIFTTDGSTTDPTQFNFASETLFVHCKFKNNRTHLILENTQSLNNLFLQTDFENEYGQDENGVDKDDVNSPMILDKCGGGFTFDSCSIMGGSTLLYIDHPDSTNALMSEETIRFLNCRMETYTTHNGNIIYQTDSRINYYQSHYIVIENMTIYQHQTDVINLLNYIGRLNANINNLELKGRTLNIEYNTIAGGSNKNFENLSNVIINNVNGKITSSKGNRSTDTSNEKQPTIIYNNKILNYTNKLDTLNFRDLTGCVNFSKYNYNFNNLPINNLCITHPASGYQITNQKFILPKDLSLFKFYAYKQGSRRGVATTYNLYMVKDNSEWVDSTTFDKTTDATLISTISYSTTETGYKESLIAVNEGSDIRTGKVANYTESRYFIEIVGTNGTSGIIGITYI